MAAKFSTKVNLNNGKGRTSSVARRQSSNIPSRLSIARQNKSTFVPKGGVERWISIRGKRLHLSKTAKRKLKKVGVLLLGLAVIIGTIGGLWLFAYLQKLNEELPAVDAPFGDRELATVVYDRNGVQLYKVFNQFNRDKVDINEIPEHVKWAFLAAEDIDFYTHQGFDPAAILRCGIYYLRSAGGETCGGSTITQQVTKIVLFGSEVKLERKFKELLMSLKIEQVYSKDQILQLYLTVAPFGSSIYGITTAARFYFGVEPKDLSLAQAALLASIIQNPYYLSPTLSPDPTVSQPKVKERQEYVLRQMEIYMNKINDQTRSNKDDLELDDVLTQEMIDTARDAELVYRPPIATDIKAGHFVNYVLEQLQKRNYKNGEEPFTLTDLQTGGYKIYTTMDYDLQQVAEATTKDAVTTYGGVYNYSNAALMTLQPETGQILTMAGSKDYFGVNEGCNEQGKECRFNGQVNVLNTTQSPGSSTKPFGTYEAYRQGILFPGSFLPDIPIDVGGGVALKNWNGSYLGVGDQATAANMLRVSRNLPAVVVLEAIGIPTFLQTMRTFGYTTFTDDSQYGHSVILGGSDVIPIEHAQGYGVFATGGYLVKHEVVLKIEDRDGNVVYQAEPQREKVADDRAAFLINDTLKNNHGLSWDGRDVSAKSGTSQDNRDVWIVMFSPDFVTLSWAGNNNNEITTFSTFGESAVVPWVKNYMRQVGDSQYFAARTEFPRPAGVVSGGGCGETDKSKCFGSFEGMVGGYRLEGMQYKVDNIRSKVRVCKDQKDRLARPVDEALGMAEDATFIQYIMPVAHWQKFLDDYLQGKNGPPTLFCSVDRSGTGTPGPFFQTFSPAAGATVSGTIRFQGSAYTTAGEISTIQFYLDSTLLGTESNKNIFDVTYPIPGSFDNGQYDVRAVATDTNGLTSTRTVTIFVGSVTTSNMVLTVPGGPVASGVPQNITLTYTGGGTVTAARLYFQVNAGAFTLMGNMTAGVPNSFSFNWASPTVGTYRFYATADKGTTGLMTSPTSANVVVSP